MELIKIGFAGNPVHHSLLPYVYKLIGEQIGLHFQIDSFQTEANEFNEVIWSLQKQGYLGVCVTLPHKFLAYEIATDYSERAKLAGSANFLFFKNNGKIYADNSDGAGFFADLKNNEITLTGKRILILGTGGAARGIIHPVIKCAPKSIEICGRSLEAINKFRDKFIVEIDKNIGFLLYSQLQGEKYDVIINCTSIGVSNEDLPLNPALIDKHTICYDLAYKAENTTFQKFALNAGAYCALNGTGMLVEQAAEIVKYWTDKIIKTQPIITSLRERLSSNIAKRNA